MKFKDKIKYKLRYPPGGIFWSNRFVSQQRTAEPEFFQSKFFAFRQRVSFLKTSRILG